MPSQRKASWYPNFASHQGLALVTPLSRQSKSRPNLGTEQTFLHPRLIMLCKIHSWYLRKQFLSISLNNYENKILILNSVSSLRILSWWANFPIVRSNFVTWRWPEWSKRTKWSAISLEPRIMSVSFFSYFNRDPVSVGALGAAAPTDFEEDWFCTHWFWGNLILDP